MAHTEVKNWYVRTKSFVVDKNKKIINIEEEKIDPNGKVIKSQKYQISLSQYDPQKLFDMRKKLFG
jgi:hypothetical protein